MSRAKREDTDLLYKEYARSIFSSLELRTINPKLLSVAWLEMNKESPESGLMLIISCLLNACGIELPQTEIERIYKKNKKFSKYLLEKSKDTNDYPLKAFTKSNRISVFQDFFKFIVTESAETLQSLIKILSYIEKLTSISIRSLRYASTLSSLGLLHGLIVHKQRYLKNLMITTNSREESKLSKNSARYKDQSLEIESLESDIKFLDMAIDQIISNVLLVRYQDVMFQIRLQCILTMGKEMINTEYKDIIVEPLTKLCFDGNSEVRLKVLKMLQGFDSKIGSFKQRIMDMMYDIDDKCCAASINLLRIHKIMLNKEDIIKICDLAWVNSEDIRDAAFSFIVSVYFNGSLPVEISDCIGLGLEQGKHLTAEKAILALIEFFRERAVSIHRSDYFVKGLWAKTSAIRACDTMCELLSRGSSSKSVNTALSEEYRIILINFLLSISKTLAENTKNKSKLVNISAVILAKLPGLLVYYQQDENTLRELIKLPQTLDLACLTSTDLRDPFLSTIEHLKSIFLNSNDSAILINSGNALVKFGNSPHPLQKEAKNEMVKVIDEITSKDKKNNNKIIHIGRIESILKVKDITEDLNVNYIKICESYLGEYTDQVLGIVFYWHLWILRKLFQDEILQNQYEEIRNSALFLFHKILDSKEYQMHRLVACRYLCETLFLVSGQKALRFGNCFYEIQHEIWTAIEKFMIYSHLPKNDYENSEEADEICMLVARIIVSCQSLTNSHLSSSFIAFYGRSNLKNITVIVKQVLTNFKSRDDKQEGPFTEEKLFLSIIFQSIMKVLCKGSSENILDMKELAKKLVGFITVDLKKNKSSEKFITFVTEIIDFSFTDPRNLGMLNCLIIFITKSTMEITKIKDAYDHIKFYSDNLTFEDPSVAGLIEHLRKLIGLRDTQDENSSENQDENEEMHSSEAKVKINKQSPPVEKFEKPKIYKAAKNGQLRERLSRASKKQSSPYVKPSNKRKSRGGYANEEEGIEEPIGRTRKAALKRKLN